MPGKKLGAEIGVHLCLDCLSNSAPIKSCDFLKKNRCEKGTAHREGEQQQQLLTSRLLTGLDHKLNGMENMSLPMLRPKST